MAVVTKYIWICTVCNQEPNPPVGNKIYRPKKDRTVWCHCENTPQCKYYERIAAVALPENWRDGWY